MSYAKATEIRRSLSPAEIEAYVPVWVRRQLADEPSVPRQARERRLPAAVLFADLSGFTRLTEGLARHGTAGAETVQELLNARFGPLVKLVTAHGGEVYKFPGDAVLALWIADGGEDLSTKAQRACQCGLAVHDEVAAISRADGSELRLRAGIGAGEIWLASVGGVGGRWEALVAGAGVEQAARAASLVEPGELAVAPEAWEALARCFVGRAERGVAVVSGLASPLAPAAAPELELPECAAEALGCYVSRALLARLGAGQMRWLAEFRLVSVLFVRIGGLDYGAATVLDRVQAAVRALQEVVYRYGGTVNQLVVDDKGTVAVAGWGLPLHGFDDDAARAVKAALDVTGQLASLDLSCSAGIATGPVFTGHRGGHGRVELAMIGAGVNLAARLMQAAAGGVYCDPATREAAGDAVELEALPPIRVKGVAEPVAVYQPLRQGRPPRAGGPLARARPRLIDRRRELAVLERHLAALTDGGASSAVHVTGDAGIGKSSLLEAFVERAAEAGVRPLLGVADALESTTPFAVWSAVFARLLGFAKTDPPALRRERVRGWLGAGHEDHLSLLSGVLGLDLPETDTARRLTAEARAETARDLLARLFRAAAGARPTLLVVEDAHWLDSASWALLETLRRQAERLLLVLVTRPLAPEELPEEGRKALAATARLELGALTAADALDLACDRLGVDELPAALRDLIAERAEGHPFFTEELVFALRDRGILRLVNGRCTLAEEARDLGRLLPDTIQGVVTSRIDRLSLDRQLTLKVASVVGRLVFGPTLEAVHPLADRREELAAQLDGMVRLDLLLRLAASEYLFKHLITHEVAYGLLPFDQRRELHRAVAEHLEAVEGDNPRLYAVLADHWTRAGAVVQAVAYLEKSGQETMRAGVYPEAAKLYEQLLEMRAAGEPGSPSAGRASGAAAEKLLGDRSRRAGWHRRLGHCYWRLGRLTESRRHYERALTLLGLGVQHGPLRTPLALAGNLVRLPFRRAWRWLWRGRAPRLGFRERCEVFAALWGLAALYYMANDVAACFLAQVRILNRAERADRTPEQAHAAAGVAFLAGLLRLRRLAGSLFDRARATAEEIGDPAALADVLYSEVVFRIGYGELGPAEEKGRQALALHDRFGDRSQRLTIKTALAGIAWLECRNEQAEALLNEIGAEARETDDRLHQVRSLSGLADVAVCQGRFGDAVAHAERAAAWAEETGETAAWFRNAGAAALARWHDADHQEARRWAAAALELVRREPPLALHAIAGYSYLNEAYLEMLRSGGCAELWRDAERLLRATRRAARFFPTARPHEEWIRGCHHELRGRPRRARGLWEKARRDAEKTGQRYEVALARYSLGRRPEPAVAERREHLLRAREVFAAAGAAPMVAKTDEALAALAPPGGAVSAAPGAGRGGRSAGS